MTRYINYIKDAIVQLYKGRFVNFIQSEWLSYLQRSRYRKLQKGNQKWRKKLCYLFFIFMGWVIYFYFCNMSFFITGNAPLILQIFNSKTHVILFLTRKLLFLSYVLLLTILFWIFLNCFCHLNFLSLIYFFHCYVNHE